MISRPASMKVDIFKKAKMAGDLNYYYYYNRLFCEIIIFESFSSLSYKKNDDAIGFLLARYISFLSN